jgi:hypothetical protein
LKGRVNWTAGRVVVIHPEVKEEERSELSIPLLHFMRELTSDLAAGVTALSRARGKIVAIAASELEAEQNANGDVLIDAVQALIGCGIGTAVSVARASTKRLARSRVAAGGTTAVCSSKIQSLRAHIRGQCSHTLLTARLNVDTKGSILWRSKVKVLQVAGRIV